MLCNTFYKPAGKPLAGFSLLPYVPICFFSSSRDGLVCRHRAIVQYAQLTRACIVQFAQFPTSQAISIFLQIRLDSSNYHIFPPCFAQMK